MQKNRILTDDDLLSEESISYRKYMKKVIGKSNDDEEFKHIIKRELRNEGIFDWAFSLLDLPDKLTAADPVGTIDPEVIDAYIAESLFENDMILQHFEMSNTHLFQSDIEAYIAKSPVSSKLMVGHSKIIKLNKAHGHEDVCCFPIKSDLEGNRIMISLTSKGGDPKKFKKHIMERLAKFKNFALAVNDIGAKKFPSLFHSPVKEYNGIASSKPIYLLAIMADMDFDVRECANHTGLAISTVNNHLAKVRNFFNTRTNHGAYRFAQLNGYIPYK